MTSTDIVVRRPQRDLIAEAIVQGVVRAIQQKIMDGQKDILMIDQRIVISQPMFFTATVTKLADDKSHALVKADKTGHAWAVFLPAETIIDRPED